MREGVDFSSSKRPDIKAFDAKPIRDFVVRYVSYLGNPKNITKPEADFWNAQGISIAVVFETTAGRAKMGSAAGKADAVAARNCVTRAGGPADGGVIYFAVDFPATREDQQMINAYFMGVASVLGLDKVGAYGSHDVIARLVDAKLITWKFQTYAWSGGIEYPGLNLYQYKNDVPFGGIMVDFDRAYTANFGQWDWEDDGEFRMDADAKKAFAELTTKIDALGPYIMNRKDDLPAHASLTDIYDVVRKIEDLVRAPLGENDLGNIQVRMENALRLVLNLRQTLLPLSGTKNNDELAHKLLTNSMIQQQQGHVLQQAFDRHQTNIITKLNEVQEHAGNPGSHDPEPVDLGPVLAGIEAVRDLVLHLKPTDLGPVVSAVNGLRNDLATVHDATEELIGAAENFKPIDLTKTNEGIGKVQASIDQLARIAEDVRRMALETKPMDVQPLVNSIERVRMDLNGLHLSVVPR